LAGKKKKEKKKETTKVAFEATYEGGEGRRVANLRREG